MPLPLESVRVLDLTRLLPGPYCTMLLADFGAEVIKIEDPEIGDYARWQEPRIDDASALFHSLNRNKKSFAVNLKTEVGRELFWELVKGADVIIESFRPGVMSRLGLGYDDLKESNPKLIYCSLTGYGQNGPYADWAGHDLNFIGLSGLLDLLKGNDGRPVLTPVQMADLCGGAFPAAVGILLALIERERSGRGQYIDISMLDGVISLLQTTLPDYLETGKLPKHDEGPLTGGKACYGVYETKDGRFLAVAALEKKFWRSFCNTIEREDLIDLHEAPLREQNKMKADIQSVIEQRALSDWMDAFSGMDACVTPVSQLNEAVCDSHIQAREMILPKDGLHYISTSIKLSETPSGIRFAAPKLGQHTEELLEEIGLSREEMVMLKKNKVIPREKKI
ncbi:MAG TPA: CaiB/BaiF CoA-transferase family protein [Bacillales bacterium]|nr:CaiB/BaiF CoA-transferase family protein [Bacillales bacterium]